MVYLNLKKNEKHQFRVFSNKKYRNDNDNDDIMIWIKKICIFHIYFEVICKGYEIYNLIAGTGIPDKELMLTR